MGRKLKDEEFADPDFQALFIALEKVSKPVVKKIAELKRAVVAQSAAAPPSRDGASIKL